MGSLKRVFAAIAHAQWQQQMVNGAQPLMQALLAIMLYLKIWEDPIKVSLCLRRDKTKNTPNTVRTAPDRQNQLHSSTQPVVARVSKSEQKKAAPYFPFQSKRNNNKKKSN